MKFSTVLAASVALVASYMPSSHAAPATDLQARQLGGGPNDPAFGAYSGWGRTWYDTRIVVPNNFDAIPRSDARCSYDIVFRRDARDTYYYLSYYSIFGEGEVETQELKKPINLQYRGTTDSTGRREYYAFIEDACSTFYTARPQPRVFKIYFTEKGRSSNNYISPKFY
ncbi:hypothetical protein OC846_005324 [Tilletia horrida]|uniref:CUB domain-containing protein n=1 Tax=Tilletia horrida TaxID=155126 RepID=A0AAN6GKQ3_9BASI|nr:hypothetical protein OC846_005324 [Tilletia horrida]KAK0562073.1 hypothetical protein OC861_005510 [Tilletia horrida]